MKNNARREISGKLPQYSGYLMQDSTLSNQLIPPWQEDIPVENMVSQSGDLVR